MKITAKQYALGLYDLLDGKKPSEVEKIINQFLNFLVKQRDFNKSKDIIRELDNIFQNQLGNKEVVISSARSLNSESLRLLKKYLERKTNSSSIIIKEEIDPKIIGGFVARYEDKVIDGSLHYNLALFRQQLSN